VRPSDEPRRDWTAVLRRRPIRMIEGKAAGGYTNVFEIICCDCGDHPYLDDREVSLELQRIRGPYTMAAGAAAYLKHVEQHRSAGDTGIAMKLTSRNGKKRDDT